MVSGWKGSEVIVSSEKGDIEDTAREAAHTYDAVVGCGGDGTMREVAVGLIRSGTDTPMGIIPLGSGNDFSKSVGIPNSIPDSLHLLKQGTPERFDIGQCNNLYFVNSLGFGFDGLTNRIAERISRLSGGLRYGIAALKANFSMEPFNLTARVGDRVIAGPHIMITAANGKVEGGNFRIAPQASPQDGILNFIFVEPVSKWVLPFLLPVFLIGRQNILNIVSETVGKSIHLEFSRAVHLHADGEVIKNCETDFNIRVREALLPVIC